MSCDFSSHVLAQMDLWNNLGKYRIGVHLLEKNLDEEVAALHLDAIGVKLTRMSPEQADYMGVPIEGPFKPNHYRY